MCKAEVGDVGVGTFKKLMSALVDSTMLYGVEIWGCMRSLETIEQVQLCAFRKLFEQPLYYHMHVETITFYLTSIINSMWSAWRKISWRHSFFRCLYPCLGKVSTLFRTISFSFQAVRDKYLSRAQRLRKEWPFCSFCTRHKLLPMA